MTGTCFSDFQSADWKTSFSSDMEASSSVWVLSLLYL
jgi:hypothetical protein